MIRNWLIVILLFGVGVLAWREYTRPAPAVETPAPAAVQPDGSRISERRIDPASTPKVQIPKGTTLLRHGEVKVKPKDMSGDALTIDYAAVRDSGGVRVITRSDQGEVTGGFDIPDSAFEQPKPWAIGLAGSSSGVAGVVSRDVGKVFGVPVAAMAIGTHDVRGGKVERRVYIGASARFSF